MKLKTVKIFTIWIFTIAGIIGLNRTVPGNEHATVDSNLSVFLPCLEAGVGYYQAELSRYEHPADSSRYYWMLNKVLPGESNELCATVEPSLTLSIPSVEAGGLRYQVELSSYNNPNDFWGYYWQLYYVQPIEDFPAVDTGGTRCDSNTPCPGSLRTRSSLIRMEWFICLARKIIAYSAGRL